MPTTSRRSEGAECGIRPAAQGGRGSSHVFEARGEILMPRRGRRRQPSTARPALERGEFAGDVLLWHWGDCGPFKTDLKTQNDLLEWAREPRLRDVSGRRIGSRNSGLFGLLLAYRAKAPGITVRHRFAHAVSR